MFFAGKGGVGKTTCASAYALSALRRDRADVRVLLVSTDPAHSLGDVLGVKLSASPRRVLADHGRGGTTPASAGLYAVELDAPRAFERWLAERRAALADVLDHGTLLDRDDIDALLELPLPGIDELVGMLEIVRLASAQHRARERAGDGLPSGPSPAFRSAAPYDLVVVDTAPTGHMLRLIASPEAVVTIAEVLDAMQEEHRRVREQFARVGRPEAADRVIELIAEEARATSALLRNADRTMFAWVTHPEPLSLTETGDGIGALERTRIHVDELVVNRVLPDNGPCPICDRRRADERRVVAKILQRFGRGRRIRLIAASVEEPRGVNALLAIGRKLSAGPEQLFGTPRLPRSQPVHGAALSISQNASVVRSEDLDVLRRTKLLFFGGKGGVGKTTVAAAAALRLARAERSRRMLLLSTDPAHSIADALSAPPDTLGDKPRTVPGAPGNLAVRELDAAKTLTARRSELERALGDIAAVVGASTLDDDAAGSAAHLIDLAPPGIDELFGVLTVVDAIQEYDVVLVDTAPTGHTLRLLELPETAREWVQVLLRMLLKYKSVARPGKLAAQLVNVSKSIRELQALLRDPSRTRFIVVTRAADVVRAETERLLNRLRRLKLATPAIVVNAMTLDPGRCRWCRAVAAVERHKLAALRQRCRRRSDGCVIIQTPLAAPPPRDVRTLEHWAAHWVVENEQGT